MAGGPSTPELCAAVSQAGGLGFLAGGYRTAAALAADIAAVRAMTARPFGVNVFVPSPLPRPEEATATARWVGDLRERYGELIGEPRYDDDGWQAKLELLEREAVHCVSFTFGAPPPDVADRLRAAGSRVWVTATTLREAQQAGEGRTVDALVLQGVEAGGHRASWVDSTQAEHLSTLVLLRLVAAQSQLPLVATGGLADRRGVAAALAAGASSVQVGTAFMRAPEAGTHPAHKAALAQDIPTALTRAFSGRLARGLRNRFLEQHSTGAPIAYPQIHHATSPLRAAARANGDTGAFNLWAGQAHRLALGLPAAEIVARLTP
ncbi:MAG: nitronate monooxygenase [Solirubrobacteraceae bacterium]